MNNVKENRQKWVDALESGKYHQGRCVLESKDGLCCLGVACKVYEQETGNVLPRDVSGFYTQGFLECIYDGSNGDGTWRQQVTACTSTKCPLYNLRPLTKGVNHDWHIPDPDKRIR